MILFRADSKGTIKKDVAILFSVFISIVLLRLSWVSEDAFFTLRMVYQFLHGNGLVWNVGERVLVATSPLHLLLSCCAIAVTHEYYWTTIGLSYIIIIVFLLGWWRLCQFNILYYTLSLLTLIYTAAFRDFAISGFESPLLFALITWIFVAYRARVGILWFSILCTLLALTRFDSVFFIIPMALLYLWRQRNSWTMKFFFRGFCGTLPLWIWIIFSFLYFGFVFPNTYYAKTNALFPPYDQLEKGFSFVVFHLNADPVVLCLIFCFLIMCVYWKQYIVAIGAVFYMLYVCSIGGDYMTGRMLVPVAVFLTCDILITKPQILKIIFLCFTGLLVFSYISPISVDVQYNGFQDERKYRPDKLMVLQNKQSLSKSNIIPREPSDGYFDPAGYDAFLQPESRIISVLTDPCLVRTPSRVNMNWITGHIFRPLPENYGRAYKLNQPDLVQSPLREYYKAIWVIVKDPVFSKRRLRVLIDYYSGKYQPYLAEFTKPAEVNADQLIATTTKTGDPWNSHIVFSQWGIKINFPHATTQAFILWLDGNDPYHCVWYRNGKIIGKSTSSPHLIEAGGFSDRQFQCPNHQEYDQILLLPDYLDEYGIGRLEVTKEH